MSDGLTFSGFGTAIALRLRMRTSTYFLFLLLPLACATATDVPDEGSPSSPEGTGGDTSGSMTGGSPGTGAAPSVSTGGETSAGGAPSAAGGAPSSGGATVDVPVSLRIMSLNVYGHATMPQAAGDYAALIKGEDVEVVGIQEGADDWLLSTDMPTDYSRSDALGAALGECWEQRYQIFVNTCAGVSWVSSERFDLSDGPNATRTGEQAHLQKEGKAFTFIDIHWDHESSETRTANATETATQVNETPGEPTFVVGDFNAGCDSAQPTAMSEQAGMDLVVHGGIDCIFARNTTGSGNTVSASPSDHPAVVATFSF